MSDIIINNNNNKKIIEELMKNNPFNSINNMLIHNRCWLCELPFQRGTIKYVFQISDLLSYYHQLYLLSLQNNDDNGVKNDNNDDGAAATDVVVKNGKDHDKVDVNDSNNINHDYNINRDGDNDNNNNRSNHPSFISNNLRLCYQYYITMLQLSSKKQQDINQQQTTQQQQYQYHNTNDNIKAHYLLQSFDNHQIQTWMSGLICKTNSNCQQEMIYFIKPKPSSSSAAASTGESSSDSSRIGNHIFQPISIMNNNKNCLPGCGCDNPWPFLSS